ncbi:hypothetical protein EG827_12525, partial [bacterium]|nr:hypothetical protein [bacterium]
MSKRPKFNEIDPLKVAAPSRNINKWEKEHNIKPAWETPERIKLKSVYSREDLRDMEHLHYAAG